MPPEPLPWDRKDFFKERKPERSESLGSLNRWRGSSHHGSREFGRWGSPDYCRPPGHGKQGGWHLFPEEFGHGYVSRSSEKMTEDESFRSISHMEGKYGRHSRDNRGSYSQRDWKSHSWENSNGSTNTLARAHDMNNEQRSREDIATYSNSDFGSTWDQLQLKEQHDRLGGCNGFGTVQKSERESSLSFNDWKPLKWTRSGSLSSRGSGFSHCSSSKSIGATDSSEANFEVLILKESRVQSPSVDATACMTSATQSEDVTSRKKPRLGWGEGLAKFEKKKVEGPDISLNKDGAVFVVSNNEPIHSLSSNLVDKTPTLVGLPDWASPATSSSMACSSSPGMEEKLHGKVMESDIRNLCCSPGPLSQNHFEGSPFKVEKLDFDLIANIGSSLMELLESDEQCSLEPNYVRSTAINKLLLWKGEMTKALEVTEAEIDYLENELKSLNFDTGSSCLLPATSSSLPAGDNEKDCNNQVFVTNSMSRPAPLQIDASGETIPEKINVCSGDQGDICSNAKVEDIDSPGTVTSKLVEPLSLMKTVSSEIVDHGAGCLKAAQLTKREDKYLLPVSEGGKTGESTYDDGSLKTDGEKCAAVFGSFYKAGEEIIVDNILESNKELANEANEGLINLLPQHQFKADLSGVSNASFWQDDSLIKEKFAMRKRLLKFKERVITLKFKAFQHLWKEDMHLLSIKKYRAKSQKKFDLSLRTVQNGYQKHRSCIRTRSPLPGNLGVIPTAEIINCTRKLLLDSEPKHYRNILRMPSQILDEEISSFISSNGLIEDPFAVEKERAMINPWTQEEKDIFMDKLATFGKDFKKIASFLDRKTTADCVEFFYKNHKSESFKKTKKLNTNKQGKASKNIYLMPSGKRWNREMSAASLDILGTASVMVARAGNNIRNRQTYSRRLFLGGCSESRKSWDDGGNADEPCSSNVLGNERETVAADVLAGICGSLSSEAMSSCITSSIAPWEGWKCQKVDSVTKQPLTPEVTDNVDDEICSDESCGEMDPTGWTDEERSVFIQAVSSYGRDFEMISRCIRTKSRDQCKVFFSKSRKCLGLDSLQPGTINRRASVAGDTNGGGSGSEDGCLLETASGICSNKLGSKMDEDLPSSIRKINHAESYPAGPMNLQTALSRSDEIHGGNQIDHKGVGTPEPLASDAYQSEDQAKIVSDGGNKFTNDLDKKFESLPVQKSEVIFADADAGRENAAEQGFFVAESVPVCEGIDPHVPNPESFVGMKPVDATSSNFSRSDEIHGGKQIDHKDAGTLEPLASIAYQSEDQAKIVSDGGSKFTNDLDKKFESLPVQKSEVIFANADAGRDNAAEQGFFVAESVPVCEGNDPQVPNAESFVGMKPVDGVSSNDFGNKLEQPDHKQNANNTSGQSLTLTDDKSNSNGSHSCLAADINSCSSLCLEPDYQHQVSVKLNSMGKPCVMSLPQDTSLATRWEEVPAEDKLSSTLDFQEPRNKLHSSVHRDDTPKPLCGPPLLSESAQVLGGYPLHMLIKQVRNGDISCGNLPDVQSLPKPERNVNGQFVTQNCHPQKCNDSKPQNSLISFPLMPQKMEQAINPPKSHSQSLSDSEKPNRNGDVKLFGQILSNPSSLPMENCSIHASEEKETHLHKPSNKTSNLKFTINNSDGNSGILKFDDNDYLGFENIPSRNYTYWDPNRMQNAYSSLPDSAILLAKYPAAFSNYPASSAKIEHQQLKGTVKSNDRSVNGVSVFPAREISGSSGVIDYQVCRSQDGSKPFTVDVKQQPDVLPEMQRHNGYENDSGLQQQGSGMIGLNVVGRGDIIVGGSCTGVSDPVAAIKMHYARSRFGGQDKSIVRDDESWRGKGDFGR